MESLRSKLSDLISGSIPQTEEYLEFCGNEGKYENKGFYEMLNKVIETIKDHILQDD